VSAVDWYLALATALFCIGAYGVLARRNVLLVVMSLELMLNAVNIALVAFANFIPAPSLMDASKGTLFALFVIAIAAAEVTVGLAIVITNYRTKRSVQADQFDEMKG
jgi:NADH-quinone oxidoreductase subunit K